MLADNIESPMFKDLIVDTLIRYSIQSGKYVTGFITDVTESKNKKGYVISYQKTVGFNKAT